MSESRPALLRWFTSATRVDQTIDQSSSQPLDGPSLAEPQSDEDPPANGQGGEEPTPKPGSGPSIQDVLSLAAIIIMLVWPWAFFGAVWTRGGVQLSNHMAKVVTNNPHATTYFVTLICSIISMMTGALFSLAIIRFAQELTWPWGLNMKDTKYLIHRNRWWPAVLLFVCLLTFPHLISSTASLLSPITFNRTADLTGTEIDFSGGPDCQAWFNANPLSNNCDYQLYDGLLYTSCLGENQMVDVLEAGRGNILELVTNNKQSLTFSQLGGDGGLHFLGSIRGVLPIGPNGVPEFNTLKPSPFSNPEIMAGMVSYDYTLEQQGLTSNVSCKFLPGTNLFHGKVSSLIPGDAATAAVAVQYNLTCSDYGQLEVLTNVPYFPSTYGNNTLVYWACQSASNVMPTNSYSIYLAGVGNAHGYNATFGSMNCSVQPIQTAIIPVKYNSTTNIFSAAQPAPESSQNITFSSLLTHALTGLGEIVSEGQNFETNLVAESVLTFAYKSFNVPVNDIQNPNYLRLFEQIIQGILEYEVSYLRLIYSTVDNNRPSSCNRTLTGSANYQVVGWFVSRANVGFLIPITIINGAAFVALVIAMWIAWNEGHLFPPGHPRPVKIEKNVDDEGHVPDEWSRKVIYNPTTLFTEFFKKDVVPNLKKGIKTVEHEVGEVKEMFVPGSSGDRQQEDIAPADDRPQKDIAPADDRLQENVAR